MWRWACQSMVIWLFLRNTLEYWHFYLFHFQNIYIYYQMKLRTKSAQCYTHSVFLDTDTHTPVCTVCDVICMFYVLLSWVRMELIRQFISLQLFLMYWESRWTDLSFTSCRAADWLVITIRTLVQHRPSA